jgi:galactonate dehydratase
MQAHNGASPVATASAIQLDACIPNFIIQEIVPYWTDTNYTLVTNAIEHHIDASHITLLTRPASASNSTKT